MDIISILFNRDYHYHRNNLRKSQFAVKVKKKTAYVLDGRRLLVFCKNTWKPLIQRPNRVVMWSKSKKTQTHNPYPQVLLLFKTVETLAWNILTDNILPTWCWDFIKRFAFIILQNITYAFPSSLRRKHYKQNLLLISSVWALLLESINI